MNYELAKELKEAGFRNDIYLYEDTKEVGNAPTLEELIKACGDKFRKLTLHSENEKHPLMIWHATPNQHTSLKFKQGVRGKTPEEAVARLWLAINKGPTYSKYFSKRPKAGDL